MRIDPNVINTCSWDDPAGCACKDCLDGWKAVERRKHKKRARDLEEGKVKVTHGELSTYVNYSCRCGDCMRAKVAYNRSLRVRQKVTPAPVPEKAHGTLGGYTNHRCRCVECKAVMKEYREARKATQ